MRVLRMLSSDAGCVYAGYLHALPDRGDVEGAAGVGEAGGIFVGWVEGGTGGLTCHFQVSSSVTMSRRSGGFHVYMESGGLPNSFNPPLAAKGLQYAGIQIDSILPVEPVLRRQCGVREHCRGLELSRGGDDLETVD